MGNFKHHTYFTTVKQAQSYLFPHVCFTCRKSFRRPLADEPRKCPDCGGETSRLSRKFKAPKSDDVAAWRVVEYLVQAGFTYQSIRLDRGETVPYPTTMREAVQFVKVHGK